MYARLRIASRRKCVGNIGTPTDHFLVLIIVENGGNLWVGPFFFFVFDKISLILTNFLLGLVSCARPFCNDIFLGFVVGCKSKCDSRECSTLRCKLLVTHHSDVFMDGCYIIQSLCQRSVGLCLCLYHQPRPLLVLDGCKLPEERQGDNHHILLDSEDSLEERQVERHIPAEEGILFEQLQCLSEEASESEVYQLEKEHPTGQGWRRCRRVDDREVDLGSFAGLAVAAT